MRETPAARNIAPHTPPTHGELRVCRIDYGVHLHLRNILSDQFQRHISSLITA